MNFDATTRKWIQIGLAVLLVAALARLVWVFQARRSGAAADQARQQQEERSRGLNPDYYVTPKKLYLYDVASAKQYLSGQTVWVREGYRYPYVPWIPQRRRAAFARPAGMLLPLERLQIQDVAQAPPSEAGGQPQVLALFEKDGKPYAFSIGAGQGKDSLIYADEILYYQDPRDLYKHWPKEVWEAIERHEVKPGMNELQVVFAIGMGIPQGKDGQTRTVVFPRGGNRTTVTFVNGRAQEIKLEGAGQ